LGRAGGWDETYIRVKSEWRYLYRAVDKDGNTIDFLLRAHRDKTAARRYFEKSIVWNRALETVTIDKSGANLAALEAINADRGAPIKIRQSKYLKDLLEVVWVIFAMKISEGHAGQGLAGFVGNEKSGMILRWLLHAHASVYPTHTVSTDSVLSKSSTASSATPLLA
jgi:hypothetical protein